jgi:hypothetical protein
MIPRKDYLGGKCSHREYYAQFVSCDIKVATVQRIGTKALLASVDENLNDIPLVKWQTIPKYGLAITMKECGDWLTLAGWVCIVKEAGRQIIEELKK